MNNIPKRLFSTGKKLFLKPELNIIPKYKLATNPDELKKENDYSHPLHVKYLNPMRKIVYTPFLFGWFNTDRDAHLGNAAWDTNSAFRNSLANVLYRSKVLQNKTIFNLFNRYFDKSRVAEFNKAEPQPQITTNSVFVYKDNSKYFINRRSIERLFLAFILAQGVTLTGALLYAFIGVYFALVVRIYILL
jgi:hypothetical protein